MKTYVTSLVSALAAFGLLSSCATSEFASSEEYDDLYFTASDRTTVEFVKLNEPQEANYERGSYVFDQQSYSSKNVNPEYIAKYSNANQNSVNNAPVQEQEYYVEETDRNTFDGASEPHVVNNFYGPMGRFSTFGNPAFAGFGNPAFAGFGANPFFYDPFFDPFFDPFWGPTAFARPGFNVGINFGFGWGGAFAFNRWNRWNRWGSPFWGGGFGRPWGFRNAYALGFRDGFYGGGFFGRPSVVVINNESLGVRRNITRGRSNQRVSRAVNERDAFATRGRSNTVNSRNAVTRGSRGARNARSITRGSSNRDFTATQNEYYRRSRSNARSAQSSRIMRSSTPASRAGRSYSRTEATSRSSRYGNYNRSRSSSPSRRGSYSTPSYNRGSRSYGNSRSSSPSYNRGSRSRSSSPSYNRGSYGGSRSSGSYSRGSSSGSRSGGRSSRGGGNR
jgi:hypothetical protein